MILVIAEKPSVAKTIAEVLNASKKGNGYLCNDDYFVSWCFGHLVGLSDPEVYGERYAQKPWRFENLPIIPQNWKFSINASTKSQFYILKELMEKREVTELVCATDAGREGECIFRYVYNQANCRKPVKRLWTSSLEESAIKQAFENLKPSAEYDNLYNAGLARAKADWLVGMNATRLFSIRYSQPLNVGRVQTPTLAMIVERNNKVKNFIKEPFYKISINLGEFTATSEEQFESECSAQRIANAVNGTSFTVQDIKQESKQKAPPKLYDLTSLQRDANRIYGYTSLQTLDYLQSLYDKKLATYPRTDSQYITEDMRDTATALLGIVHNKLPEIPLMPCDISKCINNKKVSDHHAILPTAEIESFDLSTLPKAEYNILFLLCVRLHAATGEPYCYSTVTVKLKSDNSYMSFSASKTSTTKEGWKAVDSCIRKSKESNLKLPELKQGQAFENVPATVEEHFTSPPKLFTDDTLLAAMETAGNTDYVEGSNVEKKGLGTPATRAVIIEGLANRGYIVREKKNIIPTDKGIKLIECVPDELKSAKNTADWETVLQLIEKGEASASDFLLQLTEDVKYLVSTYSSVDNSENFERFQTVGVCPVCGKKVLAYPKSFSCEDKACGFVIWKTICGKAISNGQAEKLLSKGKTDVIKGFKSKAGKSFEAAIKLNSENKTEFVFASSKPKYRR